MSPIARNVFAGVLMLGLVASAAVAAPEVKPAARHRSSWDIGEFTSIKLVQREPGAVANEHPMTIEAEDLRLRLSSVLLATGYPLFAKDELTRLLAPLAEALGQAGPGEDILLLSSYKREGSTFLANPKGITARLFQRDGKLNLIVHDARLDFYVGWMIEQDKPLTFQFGSRNQSGDAQLRSPGATSVRPDWIALPPAPVAAVSLPAAPVTVAPAPIPVPAPAVAVVAAPTSVPAPSATVPAAETEEEAAADEKQLKRLRTLKRMHDEKLITEEEYQQKRADVLKGI
jgi:hypothetical protein